jgi:hypothetical protein
MDFGTLEYQEIHGVLVRLIRDYRKRPKRSPSGQAKQAQNRQVKKLEDALARLERLPENEAERFELESEIYKIEHKGKGAIADEWPDVIGGEAQ